MSKKKIWVLAPLGLLLLSLVVLAGCRPSTALTKLAEALNALNPSTETTQSEEEQEEEEASWNMDPIDEERDDAKIREMDELIGQLLENMDEEEAEAAVRSLYQNLSESHEWGTQQYNPEDLNSINEDGALALYIGDHNIRLESGRTNGTGTTLTGTGVEATEGVPSSSGTLQSSKVPMTPDDEPEDEDEDEKGGGDDGEIPAEDPGSQKSEEPLTEDQDEQDQDEQDQDEQDQDEQDQDEQNTEDEDKGSVVFDSDTGYNIVATGQAAITVCMLGGADRLLATSPDFGANDLAQRAFNSDGQMHYTTLWNNLSTDDGSEPMTSTDFNALLDLLDSLPEGSTTMVIELSGSNTFSTSQLRTLSERGNVGYYDLSKMYSVSTMKSSTKGLAEKMDDSVDGTPAGEISDAYSDWVDYEVDYASKMSFNTRETIFLEDWDEDVLTEFAVKEYVKDGYNDNGYLSYWMPTGEYVTVEKGAAIIRLGMSYRPMEECLVDANVFDWSACPHERPYLSGFFTAGEYGFGMTKWGDSGNMDEWYEFTDGGGQAFESKTGDPCYITPVMDQLSGTTTYGYKDRGETTYAQKGLEFVNGRDGIGVIKDSYNDNAPSGLSYGNICIGYSDDISTWSTVIVKNQYIGEQLSKNSAWQTNSESVREYNKNKYDGIGHYKTVYSTSWTLNASSSYVENMSYDTSIIGGYDIIVNPTGLGDWTGQSPEAILETVWAGWALHQDYGDSPYRSDYAERRIKNFYETFYGLDLELAENQDILPTILAGPKK